MAPPQLATNTPVTFFRQPIHIGMAIARIGMKRDLTPRWGRPAAFDGINRGLGQTGCGKFLGRASSTHDAAFDIAHPDKPLFRQIRLDRCFGTLGVANLSFAVLNLF